MNNLPQESFTPTEIWTPDTESVFQSIRDEINAENPDKLLDSLKRKVETTENGIVYAVLDGDEPGEYSNTEALVVFNTFAAGATPVALAKAEVLRRVAKEEDRRSSDGLLMPVIMLANPNVLNGSKIKLSKEDKEQLRSGELGPMAKELLSAVEQRGIGRIAIYGFSNGADLGLAASREAYSSNLDVDSTSVGDPASAEERNLGQLGKDFMKASNKSLKEEMASSGIDLVDTAFGTGLVDFSRFGASIFKRVNLEMAQAMGRNSFENRVQEIIDGGMLDSLVIGYGDRSAIAKPDKIEPILGRLYDKNGQDAFISVKFTDSEHTFGDNLEKVAYLITRASK